MNALRTAHLAPPLERQADGAAQAASVSGFDELYDKYAGFVWRTLRTLGIPAADVDDAVQDVFLTVFRRLPEFEGRSALRTWLFGISLGVVRNHRRKVERRTKASARLPVGPAQSAPAESAEALDLVTRVLQELDEPKRLVFVLAELEQLTAPEIAELLTINLNTVYSRLRLARVAFEAGVARHGGKGP